MALDQTSRLANGHRSVSRPRRAERAYSESPTRGYGQDDVNLVMSDETRKRHFPATARRRPSSAPRRPKAPASAARSAAASAPSPRRSPPSARRIALPGLGLVIAGPLAAAIAGAGAGAATGGIVGALIGWGIPEERVKQYEEGIQNGGILMGVTPRSDEDARYFESQWQRHEGQHVIGTGVGATAGAVAGGSMGAVAGPVGMAAGAAIGAVAGGLAGKGGAEVVNPKADDNRGDHNLAKGVGAGSGAATGAALGAAGGPVGMAPARWSAQPRVAWPARAPRRSRTRRPKTSWLTTTSPRVSAQAAVRRRARPSVPPAARSGWPLARPSAQSRAAPPERGPARS